MKPTATIAVCRGPPAYQMTGCLCIFGCIKVKMPVSGEIAHLLNLVNTLSVPFLCTAPLSPIEQEKKGKEEEITIMKRNYKLLRGPDTHVVHYIGPNFL